MEALRKLRDFFTGTSKLAPEPIVLHPSGFSVGSLKAEWPQVAEICAYKLDHVTTDEAILQFTLLSGQVVHVSEEQPGFAAFEAALASTFPSTVDWRQRVLQPAFARNHTVLYVAPNNSSKPTPLRGAA